MIWVVVDMTISTIYEQSSMNFQSAQKFKTVPKFNHSYESQHNENIEEKCAMHQTTANFNPSMNKESHI